MKTLNVSLLCGSDSASPLEEFSTPVIFFLDQELPKILLNILWQFDSSVMMNKLLSTHSITTH